MLHFNLFLILLRKYSDQVLDNRRGATRKTNKIKGNLTDKDLMVNTLMMFDRNSEDFFDLPVERKI